MSLLQSLRHSVNRILVYTNTVLAEEEIDNIILIAGRALFEYTLLGLEGHLTRMSLYIKVRRPHCSKVLKVDVRQADSLLARFELVSYLPAGRALAAGKAPLCGAKIRSISSAPCQRGLETPKTIYLGRVTRDKRYIPRVPDFMRAARNRPTGDFCIRRHPEIATDLIGSIADLGRPP
jgi:hypothetical protein